VLVGHEESEMNEAKVKALLRDVMELCLSITDYSRYLEDKRFYTPEDELEHHHAKLDDWKAVAQDIQNTMGEADIYPGVFDDFHDDVVKEILAEGK
jgi:hypothetical protein